MFIRIQEIGDAYPKYGTIKLRIVLRVMHQTYTLKKNSSRKCLSLGVNSCLVISMYVVVDSCRPNFDNFTLFINPAVLASQNLLLMVFEWLTPQLSLKKIYKICSVSPTIDGNSHP